MPENGNTNEKLNWKQACEILGCGKSSLYRLITNGKLRCYGIGKRYRWYNKKECENLLKSKINIDNN